MMRKTLFDGVYHNFHGLCLHDSTVSSVSFDDGLIIDFADGVYINNYSAKTGKASLLIPVPSIEDVSFRKIRHHCVFHRYFGIVSFTSISEIQKFIEKCYDIKLIDVYYGEICLLKLEMTNASRRRRFDILLDWAFYGNIALDIIQDEL